MLSAGGAPIYVYFCSCAHPGGWALSAGAGRYTSGGDVSAYPPRGCAGVLGDHKCFRGAVAVGFVFAAVDPPSGLAGGGLDIPWVEKCDGFPGPTIQSPHNTRPPGTKPSEVPPPYPGGKGEYLFLGRRRSVVVVYNSITGSDYR